MEIDNESTASAPPPFFVVAYNVSKKHNIGTLARSAAAFGVKEFCLVGSNRYNTFGSHGSADYITFKHFSNLNECVQYLTEQHRSLQSDHRLAALRVVFEGCEIIGVEIDEMAIAVSHEAFSGPTAFLVGNEGTGLNAQQREVCHRLMYIPQFGPGTASLNVSVACSIVLHRFVSWAQYKERQRDGAKFSVGNRPIRRAPRGVVPLNTESSDRHVVGQASSMDGYQTDCSNSDSASGYLSGLLG